MNSSEDNYCRLCAQLMLINKLLDLKSNEEKLREVVEKLIRLNARTNLFEDLLPTTVCFECLNSLNRAFQFVLCVERSQDELSAIFKKQIKKESDIAIEDEIHDNIQDFFDPSGDLKGDTVEIKKESESNDNIHKNNDIETIEESDSNDNIHKNNDIETKEESDSKNNDIETEESDSDNDINKNNDTETIDKVAKCKSQALKEKFKAYDDYDDTLPLSQCKLTWKDYSWTCSYCDTQFTTIDELRTHSLQYHKSCHAYRCSDCNIRKMRLESFLIHVRRHRKHLKLSCHKCYEEFITPQQVKTHEHKKGEHVCPGCLASFTSIEELNDHKKILYKYTFKRKKADDLAMHRSDSNEQTVNPEGLTCSLCNKTYKYQRTLNTHLLTHTERMRDHTCDKCGKCFLSKQNLDSHLLLHENARPYQCEICKAAFSKHNNLKIHVGMHDNKKPFACEQCGRCFRLQSHLKSHKIIHTDNLPHVCSVCNKRFRFKPILKQHIRQHTGDRPYSCQLCQHDFTNWPNYNKHMKRRHGMDMSKKKHTPDGIYPIDQNTGKVIKTPTTDELLEWKNQLINSHRPRRPKVVSPR